MLVLDLVYQSLQLPFSLWRHASDYWIKLCDLPEAISDLYPSVLHTRCSRPPILRLSPFLAPLSCLSSNFGQPRPKHFFQPLYSISSSILKRPIHSRQPANIVRNGERKTENGERRTATRCDLDSGLPPLPRFRLTFNLSDAARCDLCTHYTRRRAETSTPGKSGFYLLLTYHDIIYIAGFPHFGSYAYKKQYPEYLWPITSVYKSNSDCLNPFSDWMLDVQTCLTNRPSFRRFATMRLAALHRSPMSLNSDCLDVLSYTLTSTTPLPRILYSHHKYICRIRPG